MRTMGMKKPFCTANYWLDSYCSSGWCWQINCYRKSAWPDT